MSILTFDKNPTAQKIPNFFSVRFASKNFDSEKQKFKAAPSVLWKTKI